MKKRDRAASSTFAMSGFTLLELIVVLLLISLITAFVVPNLAKSLGRMHAEAGVREISALLRYARSQAITRNAPYAAVFDLHADRLTVGPLETPEEGGDSGAAPAGRDEKVYLPPEGMRFEEATAFDGGTPQAGVFKVLFFPGGGTSGGQVTMMDKEERRFSLSIDMITGSVEIKQNDTSES
ncbi:MAG: GspH/FimT family protein [Desulfatiglandales bacterium]